MIITSYMLSIVIYFWSRSFLRQTISSLIILSSYVVVLDPFEIFFELMTDPQTPSQRCFLNVELSFEAFYDNLWVSVELHPFDSLQDTIHHRPSYCPKFSFIVCSISSITWCLEVYRAVELGYISDSQSTWVPSAWAIKEHIGLLRRRIAQSAWSEVSKRRVSKERLYLLIIKPFLAAVDWLDDWDDTVFLLGSLC